MAPLSDKQFFHGTNRDIQDKVLPAKKTGVSPNYDLPNISGKRSPELAFATTDETTAWTFSSSLHPQDRARVYRLHPNPRSRPGAHTQLAEYVAPSWKIAERIDIMPGQQGTFPQINWNQHSRMRYGGDANHPNELDVQHGHSGSTSRAAYIQSKQQQHRALNPDEFGPPPEIKGQEVLFPAPGTKERGTQTKSMRDREGSRIQGLL